MTTIKKNTVTYPGPCTLQYDNDEKNTLTYPGPCTLQWYDKKIKHTL